VNEEDGEQPDLDDRNQGIGQEPVRVLVEDVRPQGHHQIAGDVDDQIEGESDSGEADEDLRADRRADDRETRGHRSISLLLRRKTAQVSIRSL
jgi:hypothetical protein